MPASIAFNDGGAATLINGMPSPGGDHFSNWLPMTKPVGDVAKLESNNAIMMFRTGKIYGASFELRNIPAKLTAGIRLVDVADRLIAHLLGGGTCTVNTNDLTSTSYATCGLYPDTTPSLQLSDPRLMEYTFSVALQNLAGSPVQMVCHYV